MDVRKLALTGVVVLTGLVIWTMWAVAGPLPAVARPEAAVLTVCPAGPPDCQYGTIQAAVDAANPGDVVKVAAGVYTGMGSRPAPTSYVQPPDDGQVKQVVFLEKSLTIQGGYTAPGLIDPPDPEANPTMIDAQGQGRGILAWGTISPTVRGLSVVNGNAAGLGGHVKWTGSRYDVGGNAYLATSALTLTQNHLSAGMAEGGGGLFLAGCQAGLVEKNRFVGNTGTYYGGGEGGGVLAIHSTLALSGNVWMDNHAGSGGSAYLQEGWYDVTGNTINSNQAEYSGAGLYLYLAEGSISGNDIRSNHSNSEGGGMVLQGGSVLVMGNVISGNVATWDAGGLFSLGTNVVVQENRFLYNSAPQRGSAAFFQYGNGDLTNNLIVADGASSGNILHFHEDQSTLRHTTIVGQGNAQVAGVGLDSPLFYPNHVSLTDTVLVGLGRAVHTDPGSVLEMQGTLWGTGAWANDVDWAGDGTITTGTVNVWGDPDFVNPANGDYHLGPHSAAIDAGIDAGATTDLDGELRPRGCAPDTGAYEFPGLPPLVLGPTSGIEGSGVVTLTITWTPPAQAVSYTLVTLPAIIDEGTWASATVLTDSLPGSVSRYVGPVPFDAGRIYVAARYAACGDLSAVSDNATWPVWHAYLPLVPQAGR